MLTAVWMVFAAAAAGVTAGAGGGGGETPETPGAGTETPETPGSGTETPETPEAGEETPETPGGGTGTPETPEAGEETPEAGAETPETPGAGEETPEPKKGDPAKALRQERERRRAAQAETARLRETLQKLVGTQGAPPKLEIQDGDVLDGAQVKRLLEEQQAGVLAAVDRRLQAGRQVDALVADIDSYEIFRDEELGSLARSALEARLAGAKSLEEAAGIVEAVAQEASALAVRRRNESAERGAKGARTVKATPGTELAQHIRVDKAPESFEEASATARRIVGPIAKMVRARMGMKD